METDRVILGEEIIYMSTSYRIDRLHLITYRNQRKKVISDIRCRYLAKSQIINCNAKNKKFTYANFRGAHLKKVLFDGSEFFGCDFWGTSFNNCYFRNVKISDCVFMACRFQSCNFEGAVFNYTTIVNTGLTNCKSIDILKGVTLYKQYPQSNHTDELKETLDLLKGNSNIRKYKLLHLPGNKYNELNLFLLQRKYLLAELPKLLVQLNNKSTKNITTYKKLELELKKNKNKVK